MFFVLIWQKKKKVYSQATWPKIQHLHVIFTLCLCPFQETHNLGNSAIDQVAKSGVGIWVSYHDSPVIKLFHTETMEEMQEMNVANLINRIRTGDTHTHTHTCTHMHIKQLIFHKYMLYSGNIRVYLYHTYTHRYIHRWMHRLTHTHTYSLSSYFSIA